MLVVSGDFDLLAVEPFDIEIERAESTAAEIVVVDLRGLTFIDSSGLRALLAGYQRLVGRGLVASFIKPPGRLWRVFSVTGTDRLLPFDEGMSAHIGPPRGRDAA